MQEHNNLNGGICGLAHRAAARLNSRNGYVGIKEADILLDISESSYSLNQKQNN